MLDYRDKIELILLEDTTEEIEDILRKADEEESDWIADIVQKKKPETVKSKLEKLPPKQFVPRKEKPPMTRPGEVRKSLTKSLAPTKKIDPLDTEFEQQLERMMKSGPAAKMIDNQITMALQHVDARTDDMFDAIAQETENNPPEGTDSDDAFLMRGYSEQQFRSEIRDLLDKYSPTS